MIGKGWRVSKSISVCVKAIISPLDNKRTKRASVFVTQSTIILSRNRLVLRNNKNKNFYLPSRCFKDSGTLLVSTVLYPEPYVVSK